MNVRRKLFNFRGGISPQYCKEASSRDAIAIAPMPSKLVIPLGQSIGNAARPTVEVGQRVLKGERIGVALHNVATSVHASTSGTVVEIKPVLMPHPSGLLAEAVVIEPDGKDEWAPLEPIDPTAHTQEALLNLLQDAGLVGLGGAAFPSHLKLTPACVAITKTLIINGAECEPFITCDDLLMREHAPSIVRGIALIRQMLLAEEVLIGIEDNKPQAIEAMREAIAAADEDFQVVSIPTRYPAGSEKQLIQSLTGIEIPRGKIPADYCVRCFNVATVLSVRRAIDFGEPLISRVVTVAGNVGAPRNYEVLIGTPMNELVALANPLPDTDRYIMGGPMMGALMPAFDVPVVKATNAILVGSPTLFPPPPPEQPCFRCTECASACPINLQPFELYWFSRAKSFDKLARYHLFDCIECGCCAYVCPAHIPLVDYYRFAKGEIRAKEEEKRAADEARERFEFRTLRQEREKNEKAAKLAAKAAETRAKLAAASADKANKADTPEDEQKKALIAAAVARAKAAKAATQAEETAADNPDEPA